MRNTFLRLLAIYYQVQLPLRKDMDVMNRILPSHELPPPKESNQFLDPSVRSPRLFWISFFSDVGLRSTPCMKESISCLCASCSTRLEGGSGSDIFGTVQESKECREMVGLWCPYWIPRFLSRNFRGREALAPLRKSPWLVRHSL